MAGPSRGPDTWRPTRYLEPNKPDNEEVLEQAAYQAAITRQPGERAKKYKPRKTVDFMGGVLKWRQVRLGHSTRMLPYLTTDDQVERTTCRDACDTSQPLGHCRRELRALQYRRPRDPPMEPPSRIACHPRAWRFKRNADIQLLPPEAHRLNPSTSICDSFIHTSINKERSPTRVVKVSLIFSSGPAIDLVLMSSGRLTPGGY